MISALVRAILCILLGLIVWNSLNLLRILDLEGIVKELGEFCFVINCAVAILIVKGDDGQVHVIDGPIYYLSVITENNKTKSSKTIKKDKPQCSAHLFCLGCCYRSNIPPQEWHCLNKFGKKTTFFRCY